MSDNINPDHYKRLPAEAIEIIEAMIAGAPDNKAAYLHGQAAKYDLRLWEKGKSLEDFLSDWGKHIWYALRLESHLLELIEKQKAKEQPKATVEVTGEVTGEVKPPEGWRWLERGELICNGDKQVKGDAVPLLWIGTPCCGEEFILRRNRFEVGEKVVRVSNSVVYKVIRILSMGYQLESEFCAEVILHGKDLAPYIEDAT